MTAPLQQPTSVPIYALSGSPHPDTPQMSAGKAAAILAENARRTPERARAVGSPPAGGASVSGSDPGAKRHEIFPISQVAVEVTPKRARFRPKIREEIL